MTSKIYQQHPRYKVNVVSSSYDDIVSNNDTIKQFDNNVIPSSSKSKISLWPAVFWIGLGTLIFISLVILVVVPIAALADKGNATITTTISTICPTTSITTTVISGSLPEECINYTTITDSTRSPNYPFPAPFDCDQSVFSTIPEWIRFTGSGGNLLASCPIDLFKCGTVYPGWYSGLHPSSVGSVISGFVCYTDPTDFCSTTDLILVTNCNGFYVYYLKAPANCPYRYCTI